ncbi:MAG: RHS repeat-associated core domain-containing protein [Terriglobia bacterium]
MNLNDSTEGRWMTPDPLGGDISNPQSLNRYAYALNNPTTLTDPLGLQSNSCPDSVDLEICAPSLPPPQPPNTGLAFWQDLQALCYSSGYGCGYNTVNVYPYSGGYGGGGGGGGGTSTPPKPAPPSLISPVSSQIPTFKQQYNQCVQNAGTTLKVADALGVWGLGSLGVAAASSAFTSTMQWIHGTSATNIASTVAQQAPNTAADAGTLANMGEHELFLEGTWATVGKISFWATAGATAVSGGVRGYCAAKATF